jgi:hypothetical protein
MAHRDAGRIQEAVLMWNALHKETTVKRGGRVEVTDPELPDGTTVDVFVLPRLRPASRRCALEILGEAPGHRVFKTAEEADEYLREERAAWDR